MKGAPHPLSPEVRLLNLRDLAWLTASLLIVTAPHALRAPWWLTLLTLCLYGWRFYYTLNHAPLPSRWLVIGVALAGILGVWIEYRTVFGRQPGVVLLMLFSGLKLLESRNHRDGAVSAFLGYFLIVTNFLFTQSIPTACAMGVGVFAITATLIGFSAPLRAVRANLRTAGLLLAHAAPAALVLFVLFPRVQGPLWGLPQDAYAGMTGLSETMSPGTLSQLALSDAIAFRAAFEADSPPVPLRYWRGPVLWDFDGRSWSSGMTYLVRFQEKENAKSLYRYSVILEPHNRSWLFVLETAASLPQNSRITFDGQVLSRVPVRSRLRYDMLSTLAPAPQPHEERSVLSRALRLPTGYNKRALALGAGWRAAGGTDADVVNRGLSFLRTGRFTYTLEAPLLGRDSVDEFLFETRAGFCEHFAAAFTVLMRAAGVPARVVTGYQGGELNPVDRIITVRQSDAHAWTEVFLTGRGWVRVDPTAAAMPRRVESGLAQALPQLQALPLMMRPGMEWLRTARYQWEALAHKWNVWVLGYSPERQRDLMLSLGMRDADWQKLTALLFAFLGAMTLVLLAWSLRRLARPDPVQKAWQVFCGKLASHGVERSPHEGPRDFSARAARALPASRRAILRIAALYIGLRYGARRDGRNARAGTARLRRLVRQLRLA
jgi:transglutaminase-like putative cysteine protease